MYNSENQPKSKLKFYHIILFGCLLGVILMMNSNYVNNKRAEFKLNKEKRDLFDKIVYGRKLEGDDSPTVNNQNSINNNNIQLLEDDEIEVYETDVVCSRGSQELIDYYNGTSTLKDLGISEGNMECEDKDQDYMQALISIIKNLVGGGSDEEEDSEGNIINNENNQNQQEEQAEGNGEPEIGLRNLLEFDEEMKNNLIIYLKRILPIVVFLALSVLCIFGWIICCFCNCCNCCCCCCCKKSGCKIPCFIWTFLLYALVVATCFYGVSKTSTVFIGLANTECSILHFFDEILFGEMKQTTPRWAGIEGINNILNELSSVIRNMGPSTYQALEDGLDLIQEEEEAFEDRLKGAGEDFYDNGNYKEGIYSIDYSKRNNYFETSKKVGGIRERVEIYKYKDRCVLDVIKQFGRFVPDQDDPSKGKYEPNISVLYAWNLEYSTIAEVANENLQNAKDGFKDILDDNLDTIQETLDDAQSKFDDLKKPFDNIYDEIASALYDYSSLIDDYGKQGIKLCFLALALINIILAVLMFLICMCSGKMCVNCCCCRCMCKLVTHILWNVLALLMIVTFLVGSILALIGRIGGDMMSVISYVISIDNFKSKNPVLLNKLGEANQYLNVCLNGDGDIASELNISGSIGSFDEINVAQASIEQAINNFSSVLELHLAYNKAKDLYDERVNYETDFISLVSVKNETESPVLKVSLERLNDKINVFSEEHKEKWSLTEGDKTKSCGPEDNDDDIISNNQILDPLICKPTDRDWIQQLDITNEDNKDIKNYAELVRDIIDAVENLRNEGEFMETIDNLKEGYKQYLSSFITVLKDFNETINSITGILEEYIGKNSNETFSFLNGKFIGTNLKIVLKYLKYSLGKDVYTVGICLAIVGCSLIFSISSTILTIVIINVDIDQNKLMAQQEEIKEFATEDDDILERKRRKSHSRRRSKNKY